MDLEKQVCAREYSEKIEKLGVKQESLWWWTFKSNKWQIRSRDWIYHFSLTYGESFEDLLKRSSIYSAFTVAELGEMLPEFIKQKSTNFVLVMGKDRIGYYNSKSKIDSIRIRDDTEANVRAKMLIYLLENKLMKEVK